MKKKTTTVAYSSMTIVEHKTPDPKKCKAYNSRGKPCGLPHLKDMLYCGFHTDVGGIKKCEGIRADGKPCNTAAEKGKRFCRDSHNPETWSSSTDPFRQADLRKNVEKEVRTRTENKDVFSGVPLEDCLSTIHLDHFLELNLARDIYDKVTKEAKESSAQSLKSELKEVFNQTFNLGFTEEETNQVKCKAILEFANALKFSTPHEDGLPHYLRNHFQRVATRGDISRISTNIVAFYDEVQNYASSNFGSRTLNDKAMDHLNLIVQI